MRALAHFFQSALLSLLLGFLLLAGNFVITRTVEASEGNPCDRLTQETCQSEDYSRRKRSIFEYAGRCLKDEMKLSPQDVASAGFEASYQRYIRALERRLLPDPQVLRRYFAEIRSQLLKAIEDEKSLSAEKRREYLARARAVTLLLPSDHIAIGGGAEFRKTCGELGLEENASFVNFASGKTHVMICPGRWVAAIDANPTRALAGGTSPKTSAPATDANSCPDRVELDVPSLLYTLAHELGHSVGGVFAEFDAGSWKMKADPAFAGFHECMRGKFSSFPQKDYGEAAADYWASQVMSRVMKRDPTSAPSIARRALAGLCGTKLTSRHLPGSVRIQNLIGGQSEFRAALGCASTSATAVTCSL